jgi:predicted nucleic acid-binding protein
MTRVRRITRNPSHGRNYYLVDANFLANKHLPAMRAPGSHEHDRIIACQEWWLEIDRQLDAGLARVFVPDLCIAEAFKVVAKKHYREKWFPTYREFRKVRDRLSDEIRTPPHVLKHFDREVRFHDISTNRDIVISVDRFLELFLKNGKNVQIVDLILAATAKYLMEFYDIPRDRLHIVTLDTALREGINKATDLPNAFDPTLKQHRVQAVFC